MLALRGAARELGAQEAPIGLGVLESLLHDIAEWEREVSGIGLPPALADELLRHLAIVRQRLLDYRIHGAGPVLDAIIASGARIDAAAAQVVAESPEVSRQLVKLWVRLSSVAEQIGNVHGLAIVVTSYFPRLLELWRLLEFPVRLALPPGDVPPPPSP